eukprot:TRINITY_DN5843_c0_g1_i1.p1 TRINITY_DN5843_c0_g1~~TRINITY_DN5843_c0_g1_i1.p1  ORF type:complete len:314 (+),score=92.76 TRINITY_DN5843_c0_g1_i1:50-991(+)
MQRSALRFTLKKGVRYNSGGIGFIGLGNMGSNMAKHLIQKDKVVVFDTSAAAMKDLEAAGASCAASPNEVAKNCETLITMLPSGPVLEKVYFGDGGAIADLKSGSLLIDASIIGPVSANDVAARLSDFRFCDAPVSGGVPAAAAGTLTFMVGAEDATFEAAKPFLSLMGKNVVHCGPVSAGQTVKVANNLLLASSMIAVAEAMLIGTKLGCDPKTLASVLNTSTGRCWSSDTYNPYPHAIEGEIPSSRGYTGGFACDLMKKDLGLAAEAGVAAGINLTAGSTALEMYKKMSEDGRGGDDFSGVLKYIDEKLRL